MSRAISGPPTIARRRRGSGSPFGPGQRSSDDVALARDHVGVRAGAEADGVPGFGGRAGRRRARQQPSCCRHRPRRGRRAPLAAASRPISRPAATSAATSVSLIASVAARSPPAPRGPSIMCARDRLCHTAVGGDDRQSSTGSGRCAEGAPGHGSGEHVRRRRGREGTDAQIGHRVVGTGQHEGAARDVVGADREHPVECPVEDTERVRRREQLVGRIGRTDESLRLGTPQVRDRLLGGRLVGGPPVADDDLIEGRLLRPGPPAPTPATEAARPASRGRASRG
uniref:Uncharacterized protein n=1 Tax=Janibacter limosus TaxID=53458 RepID=A0AC61U6U5_9MICO